MAAMMHAIASLACTPVMMPSLEGNQEPVNLSEYKAINVSVDKDQNINMSENKYKNSFLASSDNEEHSSSDDVDLQMWVKRMVPPSVYEDQNMQYNSSDDDELCSSSEDGWGWGSPACDDEDMPTITAETIVVSDDDTPDEEGFNQWLDDQIDMPRLCAPSLTWASRRMTMRSSPR